jgi:hypothetical protein
MARKILLDTQYTFTPSAKTLVLNTRYIPQERLLLITNVTSGKVIYNFSDPSLRATSYTTSMSGATGYTTIVLNYNTSTMSATDKIQVTIDEYSEAFRPEESFTDPVGKFRTSTPQALIDTDFEYGTQVSKWENLTMINNRPFGYQTVPNVSNLASITLPNLSRTVTVTTSTPHYLTVGMPIFIQDTYLSIANGNYVVDTVGSSTTFTYTARALNSTATTSILDTNKTAIYQGGLYSGAQIGTAPTITVDGTTTKVTVTTTVNHGLSIGNEVAITGITGTNPPNGAFVVATINNPTQFVYYATAGVPSGLTTTSAAVYVRPQGSFLHRPFDGGVIFSSNGSSNFEQAVRQTRRVFRYQSGKGIQMSTGTVLKPNLQLDQLTSSGTTVTVQTREQHNLQVGAQITVIGANETAYNGTFTVSAVTGYNTFQYVALQVPSNSPASGSYYVQVVGWYGAANRTGLFDSQNGMFWEFDGQTLYAVRRNSTFQLSGKVSVTNGLNTVSQTSTTFPTVFSKQLVPGDNIVLRGQTYRVTDIISDTTVNITPAYRGTTDQNVIVSKVQELRTPSSQFNIDKLDGTGPSGYKIDLSRMQMWFIDFAWYGAGAVRFGVRGTDGQIIYCHKIANNNTNSEAYLRSGNLAGRYESVTNPPSTYPTSSIGASDTAINVASTVGFPSSGTLVIRGNAGGSNTNYEYVNYTGTTATTFTGLTRGQAGNSSLALTIAVGSNIATVSSASGLQVGQRIIAPSYFPDGTFIAGISGTTLTLSQGALQANPTVIVPPMGATSGQVYTYTASAPNTIELAYPTYGPSISHWGTSVIMDGGFDDDKSLLFTYGQSIPVVIPASQTRALLSIRISPSVDNGIGSGFGQRELLNRMQLVLRNLDVNTSGPILVRAYLNASPFAGQQNILGNLVGTAITAGSPPTNTGGVTTYTTSAAHGLNIGDQVIVSGFSGTGYNGTFIILSIPTTTTFTVAQATVSGTPGTTGTFLAYKPWTNAVGNVYGTLTSSLANIADYSPNPTNGGASGAYNVTGGEVTGGFFTAGVTSLDVSKVRDLGNSILGGGGLGTPSYSNTNIYPDGPDVLTLVATNLSSTASVNVQGRIAWTEAQA